MQRLYPLFLALLLFLSFPTQRIFAQACSGTTGGGIIGGVTSSSTGFICANLDVPATPGSGGTLDLRAAQVIDGDLVTFQVDWNDGTAIQTVTPNKISANNWELLGVKHYFPVAGAAVKCEYQPRITLLVNGAVCNPNFGTPPSFIRWNVDNENSGRLNLQEQATGVTEYLVCAGASTTVFFEDRSTLNCVPPSLGPNNSPHDRRRWRVFRYGTNNTITSATGVQTGGIIRAYPYDGALAQHGVASGPATRNAPNPTVTESITIPADAQVGQIFEITMQYWNDCNPYPGVAPVTTTARIRVVDQPTAPPVTNNSVCYGTSPLPAFQTTVTGNPTINWFRDNAGAPGTAITNPAGANSKTLATSAYPPSGISANVPGVYRVWVSYTMVSNPDGKACESERVPVTLTIVEDLAQPSAISGDTEICNGGSITFTLPAPGTTTNGGAASYEWSVTGGAGVTAGATTATTATFDFNIAGAFTTTTRTIQVRRRYDAGNLCPSPYRTVFVTIYGPSQGGTVAGGGTFCQGADPGTLTLSGHRGAIQRWELSTNGGAFAATGLPLNSVVSPGTLPVGTYVYRAVIKNGLCTEINSGTASITIVPGASAGADQALCVNVLQSAPLDGSNPAPSTGQWSVVSTPPTGTVTFMDGATNRNTRVSVSRVGVYVLRWKIGGTCSDDVTVDFGTDPGVQSAGSNAVICGTSYTLNASVPSIGTGTWSLVSGPAGGTVSFDDLHSPTAMVTLTGTVTFNSIYRLRWEVVSGTCPERRAVVDLTFSRPATAAVEADFKTCVATPTLAPILVSGTVGDGAGPGTQRGRWEIVSGSGIFTSSNANAGSSKVGPAVTDNYKPSAADYTAGSVQLRLVALDPDGAGRPCDNVNSPTLTITFDKVPGSVSAGPAQPLVCAASATLAAALPTNGGTGTWSDLNSAGVTFSDPTDRAATVSNLPVGATTLRWTVVSTLNVCTPQTSNVVITRNALPTVHNLLPEVCEGITGSGNASNVVLTANDNAVTGSAANTTVAWFTDPVPAGPVSPANTPQTLSNALPNTLTFYTRVTNSVTTCQNTGTVTYSVTPVPTANTFTKAICEDFPVGSNKIDNIDLTTAEFTNAITGGVANRTITWFTDAAATAQPIATPAAFDITGSKAIYARVTNTVTLCENVAQVNLNIKSRPLDQPLQGKAAVCVDALELYQVSAVPNATYQWTIPAAFDAFLGGSSTDFLTLMTFPTVATGDIKLVITVDGCAGNEIVKQVKVSDTPAAFTINLPGGTICENEIGEAFSVTPSNYPSSNYNWEIDPPGGALVATGQTTNSVLINFLTTDVTIKVTESNASNCAGPPQQTVVIVKPRPTLANITAEVCSEDETGITFTDAATSDVPSAQYQIISVAIDPGLISMVVSLPGFVAADGILHDKFENTTGGALRVRYTIAPISADGCAGPSKIVQLTVKPEPKLEVELWDPVCSGTALGRTLVVQIGSVAADFFIIDSVVPDGGLTPVQGDPMATGTFDKNVVSDDVWQNQTGGPLQVTYNIRPYNSITQCVGTPAVPMVFTIYPEPVVDVATKIICSGEPVNLSPSSTHLPGSAFTWKAGTMSSAVSGAADGVGATINDILTNTGATAGTAEYTVTAVGPAGQQKCEGPARVITITVNPAPAVTNINKTLCSDIAGGNSVERDLTALEADITSASGVTITWYSDAALSAQITGGSLTAYTISNGVPVYAKVDNGTCFNVAKVTYIINPLPLLTIAIKDYNGFQVSCAGSANGEITGTASLGTAPYLFSLNGGNYFPSGNFNSRPVSITDVVTVKDNKGCEVSSAPIAIIAPPTLTLTLTPTAVKCKGSTTGIITVSSGGGVPNTLGKPHMYSLNGGAFQTSPSFPNRAAGTYTVTVRDANNCTESNTVTVGDAPLLTASTTKVDVTCKGLSNGSFIVTGQGGTGPYQYSLGGDPFKLTGDYTGKPAGTYTVTVKDANDCTTTETVTITEPAELVLNLSSKTNILCAGNSTGSITLSVSGGTGPYEYTNITTNGTPQGPTFPNLPAGTYNLEVTDFHGCKATRQELLVEPPPLTGNVTKNQMPKCKGGSDGEITVNGGGGNGALKYSLDGGAFRTNGTFTNLATGTYSVTIRDESNCTVTISVLVEEPTQLAALEDPAGHVDVSCYSGNNGRVSVTATPGTGTAPYQYDLNGIINNNGGFSNLTAGTYTMIVRDANLCSTTVSFEIKEPTELMGAILPGDQVNVDCKGNSTGYVKITASGGTPGVAPAPAYLFTRNGTDFTDGTFPNLPVGNFTVRVIDGKGCVVNVPVQITEPTQLVLTEKSISHKNVSCKDGSDGVVDLIGTGGTPFSLPTAHYEFADATLTFGTTSLFNGLAAGLHTFYVRDDHGCVAQLSVSITEPDLLEITADTPVDVLCYGQNTGSVTVHATGGSGSNEYSRDGQPFAPSNVFNGLAAGIYTITVRDAKMCTASVQVEVKQPAVLGGTASVTQNVSCNLGSDGKIQVVASGGKMPASYSFLLLQDPSNTSGQTTGEFAFLREGNYTVRITDANNCSVVTSAVFVSDPDALKVTAVVAAPYYGFQLSCENASDGFIQASVTGGNPGANMFTIAPNPNNVPANTNGQFSDLPAGQYSITVTDVKMCSSVSLPIIITPPFPFTGGFIGFDHQICAGDGAQTINSIVDAFGGTNDHHYQWQESADNVTFTDIPGLAAEGRFYNPGALPQTRYFKRVVTLITGTCPAVESNVVKVTVNALPVLTMDPSIEVCQGTNPIVALHLAASATFRFDYTLADAVLGTRNFVDAVGAYSNSNPMQIPLFNIKETTTITITRIKDMNGCTLHPDLANGQRVISVRKIDPTFTIDGLASKCGGSEFKFNWTVDNDIEYTWNWGDGSAPEVIAPGTPVILPFPHTFTALPPTSGSTFIPVTLSARSLTGTLCGPISSTKTVELYPSVYIDVPTPASPICSDTQINFQNMSQGATLHTWIYREKNTVNDIGMGNNLLANQTFVNKPGDANPITYEVIYTGKNTRGCSGSKTMDIVVYKNSVASIQHDPVSPEFRGNKADVTFENISSLIDGTNFTYAWDFGTDASPAVVADDRGPFMPVVYNQPGAKRVTLTVTNRLYAGCSTTDADLFTVVVPALTADFRVKPLFSCSPATIEVENLAGGVDSFLWTLVSETGNISTSTLSDPVFVVHEPGLYSLTLEAKVLSTNQQAPARTVDNITVYPRPQAIFSARPKQFFVPDVPVTLANDSQGANSYQWDFGDGNGSIDIEPDHQYELEGTYTITLRAINDHGSKDIDGDGSPDGNIVCSDIVTQVVTGRQGGATKIPNAFTPNPGGPNGGVDNGAGMNDVFLPITSGVQEFLMQIFDRWGNLVFESKDKNIGWDGYDKDGRLMPAGVYVYKLTLRLADDQRETRIGDITMIR